jgi:hypothetical protein
LFGLELRRLRHFRSLSQEKLASIVVHSRTLIAAVELAQRWPPMDLAMRSDDALGANGAISRLWPLVEAERRAAREVVSGVRLSDLCAAVLRLVLQPGIVM